MRPRGRIHRRYWSWATNSGRSAMPAALTLSARLSSLWHKTYTIVGVMPPRFTWLGADLYLPLKLVEARDRYYFCSLRLKPGVTRERANAELQPVLDQFAR